MNTYVLKLSVDGINMEIQWWVSAEDEVQAKIKGVQGFADEIGITVNEISVKECEQHQNEFQL